MILRYDRIAMELPPPSDPDPDGAAAVQELMGGRFGEMSTFMNYTFQSFNFRGAPGCAALLRPGREHRCGGVWPRRARRDSHQHDVDRCIAVEQWTGPVPTADEEPARRRQGHRQSAPLSRRRPRGASTGFQRTAVERRLRLLVGRSGRGPDSQLLSRDRRSQRQAEGLRDGRPSSRAGSYRLSARPRGCPPDRVTREPSRS
jgi:hypothetical protein